MGKVNYLEPRRTLECCIFLDHRFNWIFFNFLFFLFFSETRVFICSFAFFFSFNFEREVLFVVALFSFQKKELKVA